MTFSEWVDDLRGRHKDTSKRMPNGDEFLMAVIKQLETQAKYLQDRLKVERLDLPEAVMRRRLLYPTALAFEKD